MTLPHLLLTGPQLPLVLAALEPRFRVHKLWEAKDRQAHLASVAADIQAVAGFGVPVDAAMIDKLPRLEIITTFSVGYDAIDIAHAAKRGIVVTNTPDVLTEEVADLTIALLLATLRELPQADRYLREGRWPKGTYPLTRGTLRGRTVGIIGLGRIGKAVARRLEGFGVTIVYHGRRPQKDVAYRYYGDLLTMARDVDTVISLAPGGEATRNMIGREVFEALGPDGVFVNVGRGSTVDEPALAKALGDGVILAAGLDVFADEPRVPQSLIELPNTVLLPHVASASLRTRKEMAQLGVDNLLAWADGLPVLTPVPETPDPRRPG